jgi:cytochrome b561
MQFRNSKDRYGVVAQFLHWSVVALVLVSWMSGSFSDDLPHSLRDVVLSIHIWAGLAILVIVVMRSLWRIFDPPPPLEKTIFGQSAERVTKLVHYVLYALVFATPIVGIGVQFSRGDTLSIFGIVNIASSGAGDRVFARELKEIHELLANSLLIVAGVHAAAALVHHWILRDRTLLRMLPRFAKTNS